MKKLKKILCLLAAAMLFATSVSVSYSAEESTSLELKSGKYTLTVNEEECSFVLKTDTGEEWKSNPEGQITSREDEAKSLLILETVNKDNFETSVLTSYYECVESGDYTIRRNGDSIDIVFNFLEIKTSVPMTLSLDQTGLKFTVKTEEIEIKDDDVFIKSISVLPFFGAAKKNEMGYLFVPDGSGATINFGNTNANQSYCADIYGGDLSDSIPSTIDYEKITMPVFGIKKADSSLFAVVTDGEADCSILAYTNGQRTDFANVYTRINIGKSTEFDLGINKTTIFEELPIKNKNVTLRYSIISGDVSYVDMAKEYRSYLESEEGFTKREKCETSLYLDVWAGVVEKKSAFLFTYNGYTVLTDGKDIENMIEDLRSLGVDNIKVRYLGAVKDEAFSRITDNVELSSKLKYGKKSAYWGDNTDGVTVYPTIENLMIFTNENYIFSRAKKSIKNIADINVRLSGDIDAFGNEVSKERYILNPDNLLKSLKSVNRGLQKSGMKYLGISDIGNTLYSHYGDDAVKQDALKDKIVNELESISKNSKLSMENPNIYAAAFADSIVDAPMSSSGYDVFSDSVPFWQIVMSQFTDYSGSILNLGYEKADVLKMIETRTCPRFVSVAEGSEIPISTVLSRYYSSDFGIWKEEMSEVYSLISSANSLTDGSAIEEHECIADGVYLTKFANGAEIYVNYRKEAFTLPDGRVIAAEDFLGGETSE